MLLVLWHVIAVSPHLLGLKKVSVCVCVCFVCVYVYIYMYMVVQLLHMFPLPVQFPQFLTSG